MKRCISILVVIIAIAPASVFAQLTLPQGGLGTTTVPQNYVLIGSGSTLRITAVATSALGIVSSGGAVWPFTPTTNFGQAVQSTTTALWMRASPFSFFASSTSVFDNATSSKLTVQTSTWFPYLGTAAGTILAVDPNGLLIATSTSAGGVTAVTATYPVTSTGGATPNIALAFGTTTANTWGPLQTFSNASTSQLTVSASAWFPYITGRVLAVDGNGLLIGTSTVSTTTANTWSALQTFAGGASTTAISWTATSTGSNGIDISAGCFAIGGTCLVSNTSGLTGTGIAGMMTAWTSSTNLIATSTVVADRFHATSTTATSTIAFGLDTQRLNVSGSGTSTSIVGNARILGNLQVDGNFFAPVNIVSSGNATINGNLTVTGTSLLTGKTTMGAASSTQQTISGYLEIPLSTGASTTMAVSGQLAINTTQASSSIRYNDGTATRAIFASEPKSIILASSTLAYMGAGSAATTSMIVMNSANITTITRFYCKTDAGTVHIRFGNGSASSSPIVCTTAGADSGLNPANLTFSMFGNVMLDVGTLSSLSKVTITAMVRSDPQ